MRVPIYSLSIHADYACRHSGACCSTSWDVPVEVSVYRSIAEAVETGHVAADRPFVTEPAPPAGAAAILRRTASGTCVFFEQDSRLCAVHRTLGEAALPSTCRLFPRIALTDPRGTFITLSHYCPTAAAMLFRTEVPLAIVEGPRAFPAGECEGLNAAEALPPLLRPGVLMDLDAYAAWERRAVDVFARAASPEDALATLWRDAAALDTWTPANLPLTDAIARFGDVETRDGTVDVASARVAFDAVMACVPEDVRPESRADLGAAHRRWVAPGWPACARVVNRYLAAHAFANWVAYQGQSLRSCVRSVDVALAVLVVECAWQCHQAERPLDVALLTDAICSADFLLRHLADRHALARI